MSSGRPLVTVLIPARDEARDIEACLASIIEQDWPAELIEVVLVDGGSSDGTAECARTRLESSSIELWKIVPNPVGTTPSNLNAGLRHAGGKYLCRVDARSRIPVGYIARCVELLETRPKLQVVGGAQRSVPPTDSVIGRGIARALNNRYTMGLSRYRRAARSGPTDTVYLGFFRTEVVRAAGGWDEALPTNQDFDLNQRLGGRSTVWFEQGIDVEYIPRPTLRLLWRQYVRFGSWKVRYWRHTGSRPRPRQMVLLAAPLIGCAGVVLAMVTSPRAVRSVLLAAGFASVVTVDAVGSGRPASLRTRCVAIAASATVSTAWLAGVWRELLRGRRG